jgi:hypothetical protein
VARHIAPHRASGRSRPPPTSTKPRSHQAWSCAANTRNPLEIQIETTTQTPLTLSPTTIHAQSICPRPLTPPHFQASTPAGPPGAGAAHGPLQPQKPTRRPPASPVPHCPATTPVKQNLGTAMDPFPIRRGLKTPMVLAAPRSTTDLGSADDFSTRMIDSYLLTGQNSTTPSHLARFWIHGVFLPESTHSSTSVLSACSAARRWLLESINRLDDLPTRVKNTIGRELAHHSRWTANATRTHHPTAPSTYDTTPLLVDLAIALTPAGQAPTTPPPS